MNIFWWILLIWIVSGLIGGIMYIPLYKEKKNRNIDLSFWITSIIFGFLVLFRVLLDKFLKHKKSKL